MKPSIAERVARHNADNSQREKHEAERIERMIEQRRWEDDFRQWKERMAYDLFLTADRIVEMLEEQRDAYAPKTPDETWHPLFCQAIELIPVAREFAKNCYFECIEVKDNG